MTKLFLILTLVGCGGAKANTVNDDHSVSNIHQEVKYVDKQNESSYTDISLDVTDQDLEVSNPKKYKNLVYRFNLEGLGFKINLPVELRNKKLKIVLKIKEE